MRKSHDHEIVFIDAVLRPQFNKKVPRKGYVSAKATWDNIKQGMHNFSEQLSTNAANNDVPQAASPLDHTSNPPHVQKKAALI